MSGARRPAERMPALAVVLVIAFGVLAAGSSYWQVIRADELASSPTDAGVLAAARSVVRGRIVDRTGRVAYKGEPGPAGFRPAELEAAITKILGQQ